MAPHRPPKRSMSLLHHRRQLQAKKKRKNERRRRPKQRAAPRRESNREEHPPVARIPSDSSNGESSGDDRYVEPEEMKRKSQFEHIQDERKPAALVEGREVDPELETPPKKPSPKKRKQARLSKPKPQWTELSAAAQILADEVRLYINEKESGEGGGDKDTSTTEPLSRGERRQLTTWVNAVRKKIQQQSDVILENIDLVLEARKMSSKVSKLRDDLVGLRTKTRALEQETNDMETMLEQARDDESARQGADRFLTALGSLAEACRK